MRQILGLTMLVLVIAAPPGWSAPMLDATVVHVDDGDTIDVRLDDRIDRVRYIGIDAPELAHDGVAGGRGGDEAARLNRALAGGRRVRLELDREERDRYGRLLAYVWIGETMVNLEMVRRGYARALTIPPNVRYEQRFVTAEAEARAARRGLWSEGELDGVPRVRAGPYSRASRAATRGISERGWRATVGPSVRTVSSGHQVVRRPLVRTVHDRARLNRAAIPGGQSKSR